MDCSSIPNFLPQINDKSLISSFAIRTVQHRATTRASITSSPLPLCCVFVTSSRLRGQLRPYHLEVHWLSRFVAVLHRIDVFAHLKPPLQWRVVGQREDAMVVAREIGSLEIFIVWDIWGL
ncbi:hypothetical protein PIB30_049827 [Stylosanthes scabra]|uniref:Uncharacterized protein n=1 Tax=Stylosanthes scabra TaxID=79078 RepID=A0ABU6WHA7_9FABA|nr:hypothetical protein [Stylosanthes scabra]